MTEQFRVKLTGRHTQLDLYATLEQAREAAAEAIKQGDASQAAVEALENGKWVLARVQNRKR